MLQEWTMVNWGEITLTDWGRTSVLSMSPVVVLWVLNQCGHDGENEASALLFFSCCFIVCMRKSARTFYHRGTFPPVVICWFRRIGEHESMENIVWRVNLEKCSLISTKSCVQVIWWWCKVADKGVWGGGGCSDPFPGLNHEGWACDSILEGTTQRERDKHKTSTCDTYRVGDWSLTLAVTTKRDERSKEEGPLWVNARSQDGSKHNIQPHICQPVLFWTKYCVFSFLLLHQFSNNSRCHWIVCV